MFFVLNFVFNEKNNRINTNLEILYNINTILLDVINHKFNYILNYFAYENSELDIIYWNKYCSYFNHNNFLINNFSNIISKQTKNIMINNNQRDPITNSLIEIPIYLSDCDITMDKYVLYRCLMDKEINPFNRKILTIKLIEESKTPCLKF